MTHPIIDFKYWLTIVTLPLLSIGIGLACSGPDTSTSEDHPTDQTVQIQQTLKQLQQDSLAIQQYALEIESQIDEVRRISSTEQTDEVTILRAQFADLQKQHTILEKNMQTLREILTVSNTEPSSPSSKP